MGYKKTNSSNPLNVVLQLVGAKWKLFIVQELLDGEKRFSELKTSLSCTAKVLTNCLKEMEKDGIVTRRESDSKENIVFYGLTDIGYTMHSIIDALCAWGKDYKKLKKLIDKRGK